MLFPSLIAKRFTRQLILLLEADISLQKSLELIALQQRSKRWKNIVLGMRQRIRNGDPFSHALSAHRVFGKRYRSTLAWAESTGNAADLIVALRLLVDDTAPRPPRRPQNNFERSNPIETPFQ